MGGLHGSTKVIHESLTVQSQIYTWETITLTSLHEWLNTTTNDWSLSIATQRDVSFYFLILSMEGGVPLSKTLRLHVLLIRNSINNLWYSQMLTILLCKDMTGVYQGGIIILPSMGSKWFKIIVSFQLYRVDSCIKNAVSVLLEALNVILLQFWQQTNSYEPNLMVESCIISPRQTREVFIHLWLQ
jgi:hypothetical protein